jgi:hypothetical protein
VTPDELRPAEDENVHRRQYAPKDNHTPPGRPPSAYRLTRSPKAAT